jgi:chromosome segregation ATPase
MDISHDVQEFLRKLIGFGAHTGSIAVDTARFLEDGAVNTVKGAYSNFKNSSDKEEQELLESLQDDQRTKEVQEKIELSKEELVRLSEEIQTEKEQYDAGYEKFLNLSKLIGSNTEFSEKKNDRSYQELKSLEEDEVWQSMIEKPIQVQESADNPDLVVMSRTDYERLIEQINYLKEQNQRLQEAIEQITKEIEEIQNLEKSELNEQESVIEEIKAVEDSFSNNVEEIFEDVPEMDADMEMEYEFE